MSAPTRTMKALIPGRRRQSAAAAAAGGAPPFTGAASTVSEEELIDLRRRRDQLAARVAELQFDLGGLAYEMAIRNQMNVELLVRRAAALQDADAELSEVERILRLEQTSTAGVCGTCGAPHSSGAGFCWQCGSALLAEVPTTAISVA